MPARHSGQVQALVPVAVSQAVPVIQPVPSQVWPSARSSASRTAASPAPPLSPGAARKLGRHTDTSARQPGW